MTEPIPETFDLMWLQTLGGGGDVVRAGIPVADALNVLVEEQAKEARGEYGAGVIVYLRPTPALLPLVPDLHPQLREAGWIMVWDHERERQGEPAFRAEHARGPTRWLATPEMAIDAAWHEAEPYHERLEAEERAHRAEADAAQYRRCLEAVAHFWRNDPLAFGDEATPTTLAGRFAHIADLCAATLETTNPGAALLAELEAARAVVAVARKARAALPGADDMHERLVALSAAIHAYDRVARAVTAPEMPSPCIDSAVGGCEDGSHEG